MKKILLLASVLIISSCSKSNDTTLIYDSRNVSSLEETEYVTISKISSESKNEHLEYKFSWTNVKIIEIRNSNKDYNTIIFEKDNANLETKVYIDTLSNGNRNVRFTNKNGDLLFSFTLDNKSIYTNFVAGDFMLELNNNFGVSNFPNTASKLPKYDPMEDCGKYAFKECMVCGNDVCDQDWRCDLARTAAGPAWVAGLAITCGLRQLT